MSEKSWASLAPLLDNRRYVESIVAGIKIKAHPQFRLVATMNDDASTFELPEYIHSRLQPQIFIDFPGARRGVPDPARRTCPFAEERILNYVTDFLQMAHAADERYTVRDGINVGALRHQAEEPGHAADARDGGAGNRRRAGAGRGSAALCPEKSTFRFLIAGEPEARPLHLFPGGARAAGVRHRSARRRSCASARRWSRSNCRPPCRRPGCARSRGCRRCPLIFYPDETAGDDQAVYVPVEPADPFTEAIRTGARDRRRDRVRRSRRGPAAAPEGRLSRPVRDPAHRPGALHRGVPRLSAAALRRDRARTPRASPGNCRAPIRWRRCWWWSR